MVSVKLKFCCDTVMDLGYRRRKAVPLIPVGS